MLPVLRFPPFDFFVVVVRYRLRRWPAKVTKRRLGFVEIRKDRTTLVSTTTTFH